MIQIKYHTNESYTLADEIFSKAKNSIVSKDDIILRLKGC